MTKTKSKGKSKTRIRDLIKIDEVWKIYKLGEVDVPALRGMNLVVHSGEFLAVMGPSGSGKSTFMNMVGCLDVPTKGKIFLEGQNIASLAESDLAQIRGKKIGFVFQQFNLIQTLSALENVMLPMIFQDMPRWARLKRAKILLGKLGLANRMHHLPTQLSGGEQQRVAIARALANDPEIVLADEPTGNLDSKTGLEIISFLKNLHDKEHKTVVVITHDKNIANYAKRIAYLKDGKCIGCTIKRR
jgi:putative ABC transport system ATP-binding protein